MTRDDFNRWLKVQTIPDDTLSLIAPLIEIARLAHDVQFQTAARHCPSIYSDARIAKGALRAALRAHNIRH